MRKRREPRPFESRTDEKFSRSGSEDPWNTSEIIVFHRKLKWPYEQWDRERERGKRIGYPILAIPKYMRHCLIVKIIRSNVILYMFYAIIEIYIYFVLFCIIWSIFCGFVMYHIVYCIIYPFECNKYLTR